MTVFGHLNFNMEFPLGVRRAEIKVALALTDEATTRDYIRDQAAPVSAVIIKLPKAKKPIRLHKRVI